VHQNFCKRKDGAFFQDELMGLQEKRMDTAGSLQDMHWQLSPGVLIPEKFIEAYVEKRQMLRELRHPEMKLFATKGDPLYAILMQRVHFGTVAGHLVSRPKTAGQE
jgi:hypothetical protein